MLDLTQQGKHKKNYELQLGNFTSSTLFTDIAPSDYHLFRSLQHHLRNKIYENDEQLKNDIDSFFSSKSKSFFETGIKKLVNCWREENRK